MHTPELQVSAPPRCGLDAQHASTACAAHYGPASGAVLHRRPQARANWPSMFKARAVSQNGLTCQSVWVRVLSSFKLRYDNA